MSTRLAAEHCEVTPDMRLLWARALSCPPEAIRKVVVSKEGALAVEVTADRRPRHTSVLTFALIGARRVHKSA